MRSVRGFVGVLVMLGALAPGAAAQELAKPEAGTGLSSRLYELATDPGLADLSRADLNDELSLAPRGAGTLMRDGGAFVVEARIGGGTDGRAAGVRASGADVVDVSPATSVITASVTPKDLQALADAPGVRSVTEVLTPMTNGFGDESAANAISTCAGSVTTEADAQMNAAQARSQFDVDGSGIKVGLLSDSYDIVATDRTSAAQDVATGDLPGPGNPCGRNDPVQVVAESPTTGNDEGRGMAQLVHDLAPGAQLAFATANGGQSVFADNIRALAAAGAKVIVDDITYFAEPMFQDGPVAAAVNDVTAQGVTYFSSAANTNAIVSGNNLGAWEAPAFRPVACPAALPAGSCMDFDPSGGTDTLFAVSLAAGDTTRIVLDWAEPWNGVNTDLDLYALNAAGSSIISSSTNINPGPAGTQQPSEIIGLTNSGASTATFNIAIRRASGAANPRVKFITTGGQGTILSYDYPTSGSGDLVGQTIFGHNGAANAVSTAAVRFSDPNLIESFSSRGPVTTYFNPVSGTTPAAPNTQALAKPDLAATDGGQTTFFFDPSAPFTLPIRFFGTSAAAPDAAAVAALQLSANPAQPVAQVKAAQKATATPVGAFGPTAAGAGLVNAVGAVGANPPAPPTVAISDAGRTKDSTPNLAFTVTGKAKATTCSVDGAAGVACSSPFTAPKLKDGKHTLDVTATDHFGQTGAGSTTVTIDTKKPKLKVKGPSKRTSKAKAKFKIKTEAGAELQCKLDKSKLKKCKKKPKFKVKPGKHKLLVQATDAAGNRAKLKYKWKVT